MQSCMWASVVFHLLCVEDLLYGIHTSNAVSTDILTVASATLLGATTLSPIITPVIDGSAGMLPIKSGSLASSDTLKTQKLTPTKREESAVNEMRADLY